MGRWKTATSSARAPSRPRCCAGSWTRSIWAGRRGRASSNIWAERAEWSCPRSPMAEAAGLNPRWTGFKPAASAIGLRGQDHSARSAQIFEEALPRLPAQMLLVHEPAQHLGRLGALAELVAVFHRPIEDVEAAEVQQVERTHGPVQ